MSSKPEKVTLKYLKPKVLLIDMPQACTDTLRNAGYNVSSGTFGTPYEVERCGKLFYVSTESCSLPNFTEQEIIIANTASPKPGTGPSEGPGDGVDVFWESGEAGEIDPRPLAMYRALGAFEKIKKHGGIFIVFASTQYVSTYVYGAKRATSYWYGISETGKRELSNWGFLSDLVRLKVENRAGYEIEFESKHTESAAMLKRAAKDAHYECAIAPNYDQEDFWIPLVRNKFGESVAGILFCGDPKLHVLILPQMPEAHLMMVELLEDWCARWNPALFPHIERAKWLHSVEYEIPRIVQLQAEIEEVRSEADAKIDSLKSEILRLRDENADWYSLLSGTDRELVAAVKRTLERLGFAKVVDVDEEAMQVGQESNLREDLRVHDRNPVLVIDVKGVHGHPEDHESTQAQKHALIRAREWRGQGIEVQPLTIINHQRHLPPHERDAQAYRKEIVENARETGLGLMTTWDLFRLLRNVEKLNWPIKFVTAVFYRIGRIEPIPEHYQEIGVIVELWQPAFGIIPSGSLKVGDRIAVEAGDSFEESPVTSLHVDDRQVFEAPTGSNCGVACVDASKRFRKGARVFVIRTS